MDEETELELDLTFSKKDLDDLDDFCRTGISLGSGMGKNTYVLKKLLIHLLGKLPKNIMEFTITTRKDEALPVSAYVYVKTADTAEGEHE